MELGLDSLILERVYFGINASPLPNLFQLLVNLSFAYFLHAESIHIIYLWNASSFHQNPPHSNDIYSFCV